MDCACSTNFLHGLVALYDVIVEEYDSYLSPYQTDELNWTQMKLA